MAALTPCANSALRELADMRISLMAVCTEFVRDRRLEVAVSMALHASDLLVFPFESKVSLRVIEGDCKSRLLPCRRRMAGIASLFERALVRIDAVAISAIRKRQPRIPELTILSGSMAAFAKNVAVFTGQRETCLCVVKSFLADARGLPVSCGVALRAVLPEPPLMLVLMTGTATRRKPHPGAAQILACQQRAGLC